MDQDPGMEQAMDQDPGMEQVPGTGGPGPGDCQSHREDRHTHHPPDRAPPCAKCRRVFGSCL